MHICSPEFRKKSKYADVRAPAPFSRAQIGRVSKSQFCQMRLRNGSNSQISAVVA